MLIDRQRRLGGGCLGRSEYPDPATNGWVILPTRSIYHGPSLPTVGVVSLVASGLRLYYVALFNIVA